MTKILALDLSTATGFALFANGVITHGVQKFKALPTSHPGTRYIQFQRWLRERIAEDKPALIVVERAGYFKSLAAQSMCVGLRGILLSTAAYYDIPLREIGPSDLKKWATGKGNANKVAMRAAALRRWPGERFADDNAVDAFLLLQLYLSSLQPNPELTGAKRPV